jgi:hypothetical protein
MLENIVIVERVLLVAMAIAISGTIFLGKPGRSSAKAALRYLIAFSVALVVLSLFPLSMQVDILLGMIVFPVVLKILQRGQYQNVPFWKRRAPRGQSGFSRFLRFFFGESASEAFERRLDRMEARGRAAEERGIPILDVMREEHTREKSM